jgi:O-methyltransferase
MTVERKAFRKSRRCLREPPPKKRAMRKVRMARLDDTPQMRGEYNHLIMEVIMAITSGKSKIIIFGAGGGGRDITNEINEKKFPYEIIAYTDNDPKLHGTKLFGKPIIKPNEITTFQFDQVIIAAMDDYNITNQLIDYGISKDIMNTTLLAGLNRNKARITALRSAVEIIKENRVKGSVAELGVFQGEFAKHINGLFPERKLYLFDTFQGFNDEDIKKDIEIGTKRMKERSYNYSGTSVELVLSKMEHPEQCLIHKGYFPETAAGIEDIFALVSLDADLYQPMLEGLKYFYPRLERGGYIFVHDYFSKEFTGTRQAVLEYKSIMDIEYAPLGDDCSVVITKR